jgi:hypothetical protein
MRNNASPLRRMAGRLLNEAQRERMFELRRQLETPMLRLRTRQATDLTFWHASTAPTNPPITMDMRTSTRGTLPRGAPPSGGS